MVVAYSDGDQTTNPGPTGNPIGAPVGPPAPTNPNGQAPYDVNGDGVINANDKWGYVNFSGAGDYDGGTIDIPGWVKYHHGETWLTDDEKDIDGDGLSNYQESHGPLGGAAWWVTDDVSKNDGTYYLTYNGTNWLDRDTDGDGVPDGSDDQDHDGYTNIEESYGLYVAPRFVNWASTNNVPVNVHAFNPCLPNVGSPACVRYYTSKSYAPFKPGSRQPSWDTPDDSIP